MLHVVYNQWIFIFNVLQNIDCDLMDGDRNEISRESAVKNCKSQSMLIYLSKGVIVLSPVRGWNSKSI